MIICIWNIRGLNQTFEQKELTLFLAKNKVDCFGCVETKFKMRKAKKILDFVAKDWNSCCNYFHTEYRRLWLMWKRHLNVQILCIHEQSIHCFVEDPATQFSS